MEALATSLLPPGVSALAATGLVALSLLTSALTAAAGIGGGLLLLSVMATFLPPAILIPTHGVVQLGSNAGRAALMRRQIDRHIVVPFALGSLLGVAVGAKLFVALPTPTLQIVLGMFILASVWLPKLKTSTIPNRGFVVVGMLGSFCTMFVGATGPFVASFISPDRLERHAVVATHGACMTLQHTLKVVAFGFLGFAFLPWAPLLVAMIGAGFVGTLIGRRVLDRLPHDVFARFFKVVLTLLALRLLYAAVASW
ncbi:MAG: TSUP family transporter [Gammaproteobacteria bacterium]|nr:TSUP family transporter [Gammaproteobacteria bacterium]NIM73000.1 TSUP family transporter [Gammaproteobacteria bacterium]NIN38616.1 TSUP family transporter [Gammaproteobacteria bacterium]NIO24752.1 TSUP family transporter [Gammaproteobacteria bacterium]NIO65355.1 TSUP family transporter [Gammaproteobacteria bacterium]